MDDPPSGRAAGHSRASTRSIAFATPAPGLLIAMVRGAIDPACADELHLRVEDELLFRQPRRLVVDLSGVPFLGLHGIAVLVRIRRRTAGCRHDVALGAVSPAAERALRLAGVLGGFERARPGWTA
jgi:anti-anti-sigma factor